MNSQSQDLQGYGSWVNDPAANKGNYTDNPPAPASSSTTTTRQKQGSTDNKPMLDVYMNQDRKEEPWSPFRNSN